MAFLVHSSDPLPHDDGVCGSSQHPAILPPSHSGRHVLCSRLETIYYACNKHKWNFQFFDRKMRSSGQSAVGSWWSVIGSGRIIIKIIYLYVVSLKLKCLINNVIAGQGRRWLAGKRLKVFRGLVVASWTM